jgi:hypothetical protein
MLINIALSIVGIFYMGLKKGERGRILGFVVNKGKLIFDL